MHEGDENHIKMLVGNLQREILLGRPKHRWKNNIKKDLNFRPSTVGMATGYGSESELSRCKIFLSPQHPDRFWCPHSLLSRG
jgi:hypothetical protein